jgi:hypothetical protein
MEIVEMDEHQVRRTGCSDACSTKAKQASARGPFALSEVVHSERLPKVV